MTFEEQFQQAGKDGKQYRGAPFWSWNDDLDPEELRRQVRSMCESGMGGFFMHARRGLITPYMSEEYFECHRACIDEAKKLGMSAWLYDEDCWPSGSAGGVTPAKGPFFQAKVLHLDTVTGGEADADERTLAVYNYKADGDAITAFERVSSAALRTATGEKLLHCYWSPNGYIDALSEQAVEQFIDSTHDAFAKVFSAEFGKSVPGIFTDEPNYHRVPWTLDFADEFKKRMGYDVLDEIVRVFRDVGDCRKVRHDFWRVVTELYVEAFSKQIYRWCDDHKLKFTGHQLYEDTLEVQIGHIGAAMPHYEYMQVPGIDHLCRRIADPVLPKQVSSVAHQLGGRRVLSEMFGVSGWNMSFEDQKWIAEWQYALGVNLMCQHLCLYSLRGWRKRDYPPSIYYQQPWWPRYREFENHFARLACALTSGKHVADVLLIHPIESGWAEFDVAKPPTVVRKLNEDFSKVSSYLQEFHVDYDYGDESIMERHASVSGDRLKVGDAEYGLVVIPPVVTLRGSTFKLLSEWIARGGRVVVCGGIPELVDGAPSEEPQKALDGQRVVPVEFEALREAVTDVIEPRIQVFDEYGADARTIYFQQRDLGGKQLFFLVNTDNKDVRYDSVVRFAGSGKVEEWNLDTGEIAELPVREIGGWTVVEREFAPTQSRLLSFDPTQPPTVAEPERWMNVEEVEVAGPWTIQRKDPNSITLDYCRYAVDDGEFGDLIPTIWLGARLSGIEEETPVTLRYTFETAFTEQRPRGIALAMECPEKYDLKINGAPVSYSDTGWWCDVSFRKLDIDHLVHPGENVIEMTCSYLGEKGRAKRMDAMNIDALRARMWTKPPADTKDPILIPYDGEVADTIREYNELKLGLDLESVYILGDFAVYQTRPGHFVLKDEESRVGVADLVEHGYCFYRGTVVYEGTFEHRHRDEDKLMLALDRMGGIIAKLSINGEPVGKLKWRPLELDITNLVKTGPNTLRIEITNSCRNLLGPHHDPAGELFSVGPGSFGADVGGATSKDDPRFAHWTDNYSFVETGLVTPPKLVYMRKE